MRIGHLMLKLKTAESVWKNCCGFIPTEPYWMKYWASLLIKNFSTRATVIQFLGPYPRFLSLFWAGSGASVWIQVWSIHLISLYFLFDITGSLSHNYKLSHPNNLMVVVYQNGHILTP